MKDNKKFTPGDCVWVIARDEIGEPVGPDGYMYLAHVADAAIATPYINSLVQVEDVIEHLIMETAEDNFLSLAMFPSRDCYPTYVEAQAALEQEMNVRENDGEIPSTETATF